MKCPNCQATFNNMRVPNNEGLPVLVNQCPNCGGVWFDRYGLYEISLKEAEEIEELDQSSVNRFIPIQRDMKCPRDGALMNRFVDENIPSNIHILRCDKCGGVWLNKGELIEYKEEIKQREDRTKKQFKPDGYQQADRDTTISRIGDFLTTPMIPGICFADNATLKLVGKRDNWSASLAQKQAQIVREMPQNQKQEVLSSMAMNERKMIKDEEITRKILLGLVLLLHFV